MVDYSGRKGKILAVVVSAVAILVVVLGAYEGRVASEEDRSSSGDSHASSGKGNLTGENTTPVQITTDAGNKVTLGPYTRIQLLLYEPETKDHFNMPSGMQKVEVTITWSGSGWDLELLTGTGECADSGEVLASGKGSTGNITVSYTASGNETLQEGQWFIMVRCSNMDQHIRESLTINEKVLVYPASSSTNTTV